MNRTTRVWTTALAMLALFSAAAAAEAADRRGGKTGREEAAPVLEQKALDILKAASDRLAAARTMRFTAVVSYESPSVFGSPLVYTTSSDVLLARPDKLRVITSGDGPPTELYDDGQTMTAFAPAENLAAVAPAPPTIDAALQKLYDGSATYYPFSDLIVADPYGDLAGGLQVAFYIGQSKVVGGTTTDIIAYAGDGVFAQMWIGTEDKLPRRLRAVYAADPAQLRHQMDLSDWQLDFHVPPDVFASPAAAKATRIEFSRPDPQPAAAARPAGKSAAAKKSPAAH